MTDEAPAFLAKDTMAGVLGIELLETGEELARGRFAITDTVRQPYGIVHGGAYAALAESMVSISTGLAVAPDGMMAMGQSNHTDFLRPASEGTIHAEGRRKHRGRTSWVWVVEHSDDDGRLCAVSLVTIAVRPRP